MGGKNGRPVLEHDPCHMRQLVALRYSLSMAVENAPFFLDG